jgi:hypothetical protein
MTKTIEYEFTLRDGSKRYEIIDPDAGTTVMRQVKMFSEMHGAVSATPVDHSKQDAVQVLFCNPDHGIEDTTEIVAEIANGTTTTRTLMSYDESGVDKTGKVIVTGGWGELICDPVTGNVITYDRGGDWEKEGDGYDNLTRVDVDEWRRTYPEEDITAGHDILDFGTWDKDGCYVGPEEDWRFNLWTDRPNIKLGDEAKEKFRAWLKEQNGHGNTTEALDFLNKGGR